MNPSAQTNADWQVRLKAHLMADKKKTAVLAALTLVALVIGVQLLGGSDGLPAPATAAQALEDAPQAAGAVNAHVRAGEARREEYISQINRTVARDLFALDMAMFPLTEKPEETGGQASVDPYLEKMREQMAADEERMARQEQKARMIRSQAETLRLQSTMLGSRPTAIINGQMISIGEAINGFTVLSISSGQCIVEMDGIEVSLAMQ